MRGILVILFCGALFLEPVRAAERFVCAGFQPAGEPGAAKAAGWRKKPLSPQGVVNVLALFARFKDEFPPSPAVPEYASRLFDPDSPGSFSHFYRTMSQGQLEVRGTVVYRRYTADQPAATYLAASATEEGKYGEFALAILRQVDREVDFGRFDNDGPDGVPNSGDDDGFVDYVFLNLVSTPRNFILGPATGGARLGFDEEYISADPAAGGDFIRISGGVGHGAMQAEGGFAQTVGSMAHEFGHALGLPDLYDLSFLRNRDDEPADDSAGIGRWGLMGWGAQGWSGNDGPNPFCAWSLEQLGWIGRNNDRLVAVGQDAVGLEVANLFQGGNIFKVFLPPETLERSAVEQGYLLLEQRVRGAHYYNRNLPGEGLLVWHVRPQARGNDQEERKWVDLVCADGLYADAGYPQRKVADPYGGGDNLDFWAHDPGYATAHGGNLGDAADPFDGVSRTRFDSRTNPASLADPALAEATTGVTLERIRRQGEAMRVDVSLPRWAGTIRGEVRWTGEILVDGDLTVAPGGSLIVYPETRVRFAGTDRLRSGEDPTRCELHLQGDFSVQQESFRAGTAEPVVFAALHPGETWYGIVVDLAQSGRILVPDGSLQLRDAVGGLVMPGAPPGAQGLSLSSLQVLDESGWETAGNGDGRPGPGETFQLAVRVDNWSLTAYENVRAELRWNSPLVYPAGEEAAGTRSLSVPNLTLYPGGGRLLHLPPLTLSPQAVAGEKLEFSVQVREGSRVLWEAALPVEISGSYPRHQVRFEAPGRELHDQGVLVQADRGTVIRAAIEGEIAAAELFVHSLPDQEAVVRLPMTLQGQQGGEQYFAATFRPPGPGQYQFSLRVRGADGTEVFSPVGLEAWALPDVQENPALVLLDGAYYATLLRPVFAMVLEGLDAPPFFLDDAPQNGSLYDALLDEYLGAGKVVVWVGDSMTRDRQAAFSRFLEKGGRLFIASLLLPQVSGFTEILGPRFHLQQAGRVISGQVRSLYELPDGLVAGKARFAPCELVEPAAAVLVDGNGQAASLLVDSEGYRLVFMPVDLRQIDAQLRRELIELHVQLLRHPAAGQALLEVPGYDVFGQVVMAQPGRPVPVRATVRGEISAAELVVRSFPGLDRLGRISMSEEANSGEERVFTASFRPPGAGQYYLALRLSDTAAAPVLNAANLHVWLPFFTWAPVLMILDEHYTAADREALEKLLAGVLGEGEGGSNVLDFSLPVEGYYDALLRQYLKPGQLVIWAGNSMTRGVQEALRRYLEDGGRLLIASYTLDRYSPGIESFLRDVLRIRDIPDGKSGTVYTVDRSTEFFIRHATLELAPPAEVVMVDENGQAAGMRVDGNLYRAVFLPFDLRRVAPEPGRKVLAASLEFLRARTGLEAALQLESLLAPGEVAPLRPELVPRVRVSNPNERSSTDFRVGYQILQGGRVLEAVEQIEPPLGAGAEREVALPAWKPPGEGDYELRVGIGEDSLVFQPARMLRIADVGEGFGRVVLPGDPSLGNGAGFFDYDGDGDLDLYLVRRGAANQLYENAGGEFSDRTGPAGLTEIGWGRGLAIGDYDGDGDLDLYLVNDGRNVMWRNEGDGRFTEVTGQLDQDPGSETGLADRGTGRSAGFFDADGDGDLDLYLVNAFGVNRFFVNERGLFTEQAEAWGLADRGDGRGLVIGDCDGDGDADLFVANTVGPSRLFRNSGKRAGTWFEEVGEQLGLELAGGEVAAALGDYDGDGDPDLFVSSEREANRLFRNEGGQGFTRVRTEGEFDLGGQTVGTAFFDYDNDGDLDLVTTAIEPGAGGDQLFQNRHSGGFVPVGALLGLRPGSQGRAVVVADYDQDGGQDLLVADYGETCLYRNAASEAHWFQLDLQGLAPNCYGLGARVELSAGETHQYREAQSSFGYGSQVQPRMYFGLGAATRVDSLQVIWPDGRESLWVGLGANQFLTLAHPGLVTVVREEAGERPAGFRLFPGYPNPFNGQTIIAYQLPQTAAVELSVYNVAGQRVKRLVEGGQDAGRYRLRWDGTDEAGRELGSGVFFCELRAGDFVEIGRLLLLK